VTKKNYKFILYPALSAVLAALAFPPFNIWPFLFFTLTPWILTLKYSSSWKQTFISSLLMGMFLCWTGFYWVAFVAHDFGGLSWPISFIVLFFYSLIGEAHFVIVGLIFHWLKKILEKDLVKQEVVYHEDLKVYFSSIAQKQNFTFYFLYVFALPVLYVGVEYLYPKIFPSTLGHGFYSLLTLSQTAELTGVQGLTFIMISTSSTIALFLDNSKFLNQKNFYELQKNTKNSFLKKIILIQIIVIFALTIFGSFKIKQLNAIQKNFKKEVKVTLVQANIGNVEKLESEKRIEQAIERILNNYKEMTLETVHRFNPDFIVWPETAYPMLYTNFEDPRANLLGLANDEWIKNLVQEINRPLLFGGYQKIQNQEYNALFQVEPKNTLKSSYQKHILLTFGETLPLGPFSNIVRSYIPDIANFGRGKGPHLLEVNLKSGDDLKVNDDTVVRFSPNICYEGIFANYIRKGSRLGAEFLLNITNDAWYGNSNEPWVHLAIIAFRSIELRKPLIRSTNTGISAYIDITGKIVAKTSLFKKENLEFVLFLPDSNMNKSYQETLYSKLGDWFSYLCIFLSVFIIGFYLGKNYLKNKV
jgi:apolipoprotein N-acyltransferase